MVAVGAGRGQRVGAYFVDQLVIDFVVFTPMALSMGIEPTVTSLKFLMPLAMAMGFVYWASFERMFGQSPGKQLFGIKTIGDKGQLSFAQAAVRSMAKPLTTILMIDCLPLLFGRTQRISEIIVNTKVIKWKG